MTLLLVVGKAETLLLIVSKRRKEMALLLVFEVDDFAVGCGEGRDFAFDCE